MPKAPPTKGRAKSSRTAPIPTPKPSKVVQKDAPAKKPRDPTHSHLYTDDNPSTTLHGTGFKDAATAHRTLELISKRSLTYQFQTVNTMYHRAKHHPAMKRTRGKGSGEDEGKGVGGREAGKDGTAGMQAAMEVFREWLDETYPASKAALRVGGGFKPLLSKKIVENYLPAIEASSEVSGDGKAFAKMYIALGKGKRLGNVLVDEEKPAEEDWEVKRYAALCKLVPEGKEDAALWSDNELWSGKGKEKEVTAKHLQLIAWAWSPVAEKKLG